MERVSVPSHPNLLNTAAPIRKDMHMEKPILKMKNICKYFPGVNALNQVDFDLYAGEVHVLVGENGAGKSTLAKCILGIYQPDGGDIFLGDKKIFFKNTKEALNHGIAAVYQELTLVPYLNAIQNIYLNREQKIKGTGIINSRKMLEDAKKYLSLLGCDIDLKTPVKYLDVAEQQIIEIAKALSYNPKIIILDEPTSSLSEREIDALFIQIKKLKAQGIGIIYVSHRMQEYNRIADRITVLRDGRLIKTMLNSDISEEDLIKLMVGRDISQVYVRTPNKHTGEVLKVCDISDKKGKVKGCSISVSRGEITGLVGLVGSGRTELARLIFGIDKPASGEVFLNGHQITKKNPVKVVKSGMGFLPEDRKRFGLAIKASVAWNTIAVSLKKYFPRGIISEKKNRVIAQKYVDMLKIATPDILRPVYQLSGGNQQKVVISKWLSADCDIMIFDEPTRGIDVGAKMEIYSLMDSLAAKGKAILMISSEMQEAIGMTDRLYIMKDGKIITEVQRKEYDMEQIGKTMVVGGDMQ